MKRKKSLKLVLVGDSGCGKTSLILSYVGSEIANEHTPTAFDDFMSEVMVGGRNENINISDTAGAEEYSSLRPLSYPDADIFLICYAVDTADSLTHAQGRWMEEVRRFSTHIPIIFVGLKADLRRTGSVSTEQEMADPAVAEQASKQYSEHEAIECSARTKEHVRHVFETAVKAARAYRNRQKNKVLQQIMKLKLVF